MNRFVVVGLSVGFAACGSEYGDCGRGNTQCALEKAQVEADTTGKDVYVDVDVFVSNANTNSNSNSNVNTNDVDVDIANAPCSNCTPYTTPVVVPDAGVCDAGKPDPMVCKHVCTKYKVSCKKKKTCITKAKVCKLASEW